MKFFVFLTLLLMGSISLSSYAKKYELSTWYRLGAENVREKDINTRGDNAFMLTNFYFKRFIEDWSEIKFSPGFKFATGNGQGLIYDSRARNSLFLNEAIFKTNHDIFEVTAGAINQKHVYARGVVSNLISFPGFMGELFFYKHDDLTLSARGQVAVPSAYTFGSESTAVEGTPRFYTGSLDLKTNFLNVSKFQLVGTYFIYDQLPQVVAVDSATQGNSVVLTSTTTGYFLHKFRGFAAFAKVEYDLSDTVRLITQNHFANNLEAPSERGQDFMTWNGVAFELPNDHKLTILGIHFRRDSDVGPGDLNRGRSSNNRVGHGARVIYELKKEKLKFIAGYEEADPIYRTVIQGNRKAFFVRLEGSDDLF